jgi:very-short-patch-repair endonuclease
MPEGTARPQIPGPTATTVATALEIASECLSPIDHLIAADGALRLGLVARGDLFFGRRGSQARGRWLARHVDARADSLLETVARWALTDAGFRVESQVAIPRVGRVDLMVEDAIVVELDGREHHSDREAFDTDRRRDRLLLAWGLRVLRFTYSDVMPTGTRVVEDVQAALAGDLGVSGAARHRR